MVWDVQSVFCQCHIWYTGVYFYGPSVKQIYLHCILDLLNAALLSLADFMNYCRSVLFFVVTLKTTWWC